MRNQIKIKNHIVLLLFLGMMGMASQVFAGIGACWIAASRDDSRRGGDGQPQYLLDNGKWDFAPWDVQSSANALMSHIKDAGLELVLMDFTNWGHANKCWVCIKSAAKKEGLKYAAVLDARPQGNKGEFPRSVADLNKEAKAVWDFWMDNDYFVYGGKPQLVIWGGKSYTDKLKRNIELAPESEKTYLVKYNIGYAWCRPDGAQSDAQWGFDMMGGNDNVRYCAPVNQHHGDRISLDEWQQRVNWVKQARDISIFGAYDGPADCQYWGIANTSALPADGAWSCAKYPGDQAYGYFNIVRDAMASVTVTKTAGR